MPCKFLGKNGQCENAPRFHCDAWDKYQDENRDEAMSEEVHVFCETHEYGKKE